MTSRLERLVRFLRANAAAVGAGLVLLGLVAFALRWIVRSREAPAARKVMQFTLVNVQPPPQPKTPPPPPPPQPQKVEEAREEVQTNRVELKAMDIPPPDAPPPTPGGGQLALAAEGEGPGDAFNLAGRPGGRGLLSGGGLGGDGSGLGNGDPNARYAWYYARMQPDIEAVLRKSKRLSAVSARFELRVWWDSDGRITRIQPVHANDPAIDDELQHLVGVRFRQPPPSDVPMPVVMRVSARRPQ